MREPEYVGEVALEGCNRLPYQVGEERQRRLVGQAPLQARYPQLVEASLLKKLLRLIPSMLTGPEKAPPATATSMPTAWLPTAVLLANAATGAG